MGGDLATALPDPAEMLLSRQAPIPVAILTGFLGSGKTTLIRAMLRDPDFSATAVIVNELGEIGLDHLLLESAREDVLLLEGGCLCCAAQGDLVERLRPAATRIVDTSGAPAGAERRVAAALSEALARHARPSAGKPNTRSI